MNRPTTARIEKSQYEHELEIYCNSLERKVHKLEKALRILKKFHPVSVGIALDAEYDTEE